MPFVLNEDIFIDFEYEIIVKKSTFFRPFLTIFIKGNDDDSDD